MALFILTATMYSQTNTNNIIRLANASIGSSVSAFNSASTVTISSVGAVSVTSLMSVITASSTPTPTGITTGTVTVTNARSKTIAVRYKTALVIDPTTGAITTTGGVNRATGAIGVYTTAAPSVETDQGEGMVFDFDMGTIPATVSLQVTRIFLNSFSANETAKVINLLDTSKNQTYTGTGDGTALSTAIDVSSLGLILPGNGTAGYRDVLSIFNNSSTVQGWRVKEIEFKLVAISSTWNGTGWSNTTPGPAVDAIIEGNYSALARGGFSAKTLTVNSGSLTIEATKNLKIENGITNNAGVLGIVVEDGGTLQQVQTGTNSGAITVRKNSNSLKRGDYTLWSSPVATSVSLTLAGFSPLTSQSPTNRFYVYDHTLGTNGLFANIAPSSTFETGKGYLIRMPNENPTELGTSSAYYTAGAAITFNGEFVGVPNNGTLTTTDLATDKFYSIGNPYPSNISADSFINGNTTGGTLYFWRKTNGIAGTAYATYTLLGGVGTEAGDILLGVPNGIIAPCQGFIVKTAGAEPATITFTNAMRLGNTTYGKFFKTKAVTTKDRVWLNLTNAAGVFSQALIGYMDGATVGVDNSIDGKYFNDSPIALTSSINNEEYTIQGRPAFDATDVVALNFKTDVAGDYSIALNHFDGVFAAGQDVYLVDNKMSTETNLKTGAYNFTAVAGVDNSRFTLKYQKTLKVIDSEFNDNSITVYGTNGTLFVKSRLSAINSIKVFDIQGRLIAEQKNVKSNTAAVANLKTNQALIVQVSTEDNKVVSKKVLN